MKSAIGSRLLVVLGSFDRSVRVLLRCFLCKLSDSRCSMIVLKGRSARASWLLVGQALMAGSQLFTNVTETL